ncbi:MAG TPA: hypothetical protein VGH27_06495 [Streptosporangiaceae bacterium]|jgi:hypothetical protein
MIIFEEPEEPDPAEIAQIGRYRSDDAATAQAELEVILIKDVRARINAGIRLPGDYSPRLIEMAERLGYLVTALAMVTVTLLGAPRAHLSPLLTTLAVVAELAMVLGIAVFRRPTHRG